MKLISVFANAAMMLGLAVGANAQQASSPDTDVVADTTLVNEVSSTENNSKLDEGNDSLDNKMYANNFKSNRHRRFGRNQRENMARRPNFDYMNDSLANNNRSFVDSAGNSICFSRHVKGHHGYRRFMNSNSDSLGNFSSTLIINDGNKTMVIRNGKDTTWYDNNELIPDLSMPVMPMMPDMSQIDSMMQSFRMPDFGGFPDFSGLPDWFRDAPRVKTFAPGHNNGYAAENPSDEEVDMLVKHKVVTSANLKSPLDVLDMRLAPNRSGAITFVYELPRVQKSTVKIVDAEGKVVDSATLTVQGGEFRRTFKIDNSQQYLYIIISADSKFAISKFWL